MQWRVVKPLPVKPRSEPDGDSIPITTSKPRRSRNRRSSRVPNKLTSKQLEAARLFGELKGNMTAVAKMMGISRQTAQEHYDAATAKLAAIGSRVMTGKATTRQLKADHLGEKQPENTAQGMEEPGLMPPQQTIPQMGVRSRLLQLLTHPKPRERAA